MYVREKCEKNCESSVYTLYVKDVGGLRMAYTAVSFSRLKEKEICGTVHGSPVASKGKVARLTGQEMSSYSLLSPLSDLNF